MKALKANKAAHRAKNLIRGAISRLKANNIPERKRDRWLEEQVAQGQINRAIAIAKSELSARQFAEFENWVAAYSLEQTRGSNRLGTNLTTMGLLPTALSVRNLASELKLAFDHLGQHAIQITEFSNAATKLASYISEMEWSAAQSVLQQIIQHEGYSYWAIETELAILQAIDGVEAVKARVSSLSICAIGLNRFFLYFIGVRNEPAQASGRFKANLKKKVEISEIPPEWQAYARFRLYGDLPLETRACANVLAAEQLITTIDLLVTTIKVARLIVAQQDAFSADLVVVAMEVLAGISKIAPTWEIYPQLGASGLVPTRGGNGPQLTSVVKLAIQTSLKPREQWIRPDDLMSIVEQGLAAQLSTRNDGVAGEELAKFLLNFNWLPIAIDIGDVTRVPALPQLLLDLKFRPTSVPSISSAYDLLLATMQSPLVTPEGEIGALLPLLVPLRCYAKGESLQCLTGLSEAARSECAVIRDAALVLLAHLLSEQEEVEQCLSTCADAGIENERTIPMLPLAHMLQGRKWTAIRPFARSIDLAIALDHFLSLVDDRKIRTYKRYAVEDLMKGFGVQTLPDLVEQLVAKGIALRKIEYFFYRVCDIVTIELLPGMGESRKVWSSRSQLLRKLATLHTPTEVAYLREAEEIEEGLQVDDGLFVLDDSKVYVDEQTILKSINLELAADFTRYLRLVESGIGVSESLADVLKGFNNPSAKTFQIPKNDADDLLAQLLQSILDRFLFDTASGLDTILGRRIRHGTIAGEIRGYLEGAGLIGHKPHAGAEYQLPVKAVHQWETLEAKRRRFVSAAFSRFSESIDQLVALLRDEYFCVRSKMKPRGIFEVTINTVILALARSIAQKCETIEQFSREGVQLIWFMLSVRLDASRRTVEMETKKSLNAIFGKLTNELRSINVTDPEFLACILQASEELQRRASTIAGWIRVPKASIKGSRYSLQRAVDIAGAVVTGQRPGFFPIVVSDVPDTPELDMHGFSIVEDALYIAFDNIAQHSGKKAQNRVKVEITFNAETSLLTFTITSEMAPGYRTAEREARVHGVRADVQKRAYGERARLNRGGSGLAKLAAIVMQSDKTNISFGFLDPDQFQLKFDLVYLGFSDDPNEPFLASSTLVENADVPVAS